MRLLNTQTQYEFSADRFAALTQKYAGSGPRYTSYPTALEFKEEFNSEDFLEHVRISNENPIPSDLSLYFHMPFCRHLCFYCGCNKIVTKNKQKGIDYLGYLTREIDRVGEYVDLDRKVMQLHLGGGTPTFFDLEQIRYLFDQISKQYLLTLNTDRDYSIEIDPRTVDTEYMYGLGSLGFNRISIGVQDCDAEVQKAIHRVQDNDHIADLVASARKSGLQSINLDLVYGLPRQTIASFSNTLKFVAELQPDRLSIFHYAHMPQRFPAQRRILDEDLPDKQTKLTFQQMAIEILSDAGYCHIGMDHFAKQSDSLTEAIQTGSIQRNFQGYTTHSRCDQLGFGVSSIGDIGGCLYQNEKDLGAYYERIDAGELPIARGLSRTGDDVIREQVIMKIMCTQAIDKQQFRQKTGMPFDEYFLAEQPAIQKFISDGLVESNDSCFSITPNGRFMLRTIALAFDKYRRQQTQSATLSRIH